MQDDGTRRRKTLAVVFLIALAANIITVFVGRGNQPPKGGDGLDYESIAYNLAAGRGYGHAYSDPEYRRPYLESDTPQAYRDWLEHSGSYEPTAFRAPGLPMILAGIYKTVGRHFIVWRLFNGLITALAVTLSAALAWRLAGSGVGTAVGILGVADPMIRRYTGYFLAEGTTFLLMILIAWVLVLIIEKRRLRDALLLGVVLGLTILMRSIFLLWIPMLLVVLLWSWTRPLAGGVRRKPMMAAAALFLAGALAVPSPWWVRNCVVLEAAMPMGTQGGIGLPGGYSDAALAGGGFWIDAQTLGMFDDLNKQLDQQGASRLEREKAQSRYGTRWVLAWMKQNPLKVMKLMALKLWHLWTRGSTMQGLVLLGLGLGGLRWMWHRPAVCVLWAFAVCNSLAAMATYVTRGGRFMAPALLSLHILGAIGVWRLIETLNERRSINNLPGEPSQKPG